MSVQTDPLQGPVFISVKVLPPGTVVPPAVRPKLCGKTKVLEEARIVVQGEDGGDRALQNQVATIERQLGSVQELLHQLLNVVADFGEIEGPNGAAKADRLADALASVLQGKAVVTRPVRKGELRITGLDESVSAADLVALLCSVEFSGCRESEVTVGPVTEGRDRLGAVWVPSG
ncbi:uncharacterized protein LOC109861784 [Pseudomyrmex gracilis]|uniref:uncharacterized protein LOC109861784 n=1 Tax=Pseudomyrmex gracilis TaxID=219809 RepID=UPI000994A258|nr:uncharacterized protein LOC109861784 [Pseudomyrmex gracilis]